MTSKNILHQSASNEWYTPEWVIRLAADALDIPFFDLDPCTSHWAARNLHADLIGGYYTIKEDGLLQQWNGHVFCNPPYGGKAQIFAKKAVEEFNSGRSESITMLVNAVPDRKWFQSLMDHASCFAIMDSRIKFIDPETREPATSPAHGNALVFMTKDLNLRRLIRTLADHSRVYVEVTNDAL